MTDGGAEKLPQVGVTIGALLLGLVMLRGVASLLVDLYDVIRVMLSTKKEDAETQTEDVSFQLPSEIFVNPQSEVFHCGDCRHITARAYTKRACNICRNVA